MSYVYLIYNGNGHAKVGKTKDLERRLRELQTGSPHKLEVLGVHQSHSPEIVEEQIHSECEHLRVNGEWFRLTRELLDSFFKWNIMDLEAWRYSQGTYSGQVLGSLEFRPIQVSANREDTEPYRIDRLHRLLDSINLNPVERHHTSDLPIWSVHDHKGCLEVVWRREPTGEQKQRIENAWSEQCECQVEHSVVTDDEVAEGVFD